MRLMPLLAPIVGIMMACAHGDERASEPAPIPPPIERPVLMGSVVGADGKPLPLAHVHLGKESFPVKADGSFRIEPAQRGFTEVRFSGVNHAESTAVVWLEDRATRVNVRLGTHPRDEKQSKVGLIIEKDGKLTMKSAVPMQQREDGTWALTVDAPKGRFAYQLLHVSSDGHTTNGTQAAAFEYDGGGDYLSVIEAPGGALEVVFDPGQLPAAAAERRVELGHERDRQLTAWVERLHARDEAVQAEAMAAMKAGGDGKAAIEAALEKGNYRADYAAALEAEKDPVVRQLLMVANLGMVKTEEKAPAAVTLADAALADIDARSDVWSVDVDALSRALELASDRERAAAYEAAIIERHPTEDLSASLLFERMRKASEAGDLAQAKATFATLSERFPKSRYVFFARRINPNAEVKVGEKIPAFSFPVFGDPAKALTPGELRGKTYLVNLWASWCKPCIAKMDTLHALHRRHQAKGFTIVAVAIQDKEAAVKAFRKENAKKWPMPWENAYVPEERADATMKQLSAVGLPSALLVGPDGTILATNTEIDREGLEKLVDAAMASKSAAK